MKAKDFERRAFSTVSAFLPPVLLAEIEQIRKNRGIPLDQLNEIRLRAIGPCSVVARGRNLILNTRVTSEELHHILKRICDMAIFAHRDDIGNGFVALSDGCRVGVCGHAKYDGGRLVGVSSVSALVFRIPGGRCDFADKLFEYWNSVGFCGMLICSKAGVGKTSAIRVMTKMAASGENPKRIIVVDERCEFDPRAYENCTVDILRGYDRAKGIEIAVRTMSAEIIVVDEIGNRADGEALMLAVGAGIPVLATTHGDNINSVIDKPFIRQLCDNGLFVSYSVITLENGKRNLDCGEILHCVKKDMEIHTV